MTLGSTRPCLIEWTAGFMDHERFGGPVGMAGKLFRSRQKSDCKWLIFRDFLIGRSERIRTSDPLLPKQVRYQTALHSDI